jgi:hypothetical protein
MGVGYVSTHTDFVNRHIQPQLTCAPPSRRRVRPWSDRAARRPAQRRTACAHDAISVTQMRPRTSTPPPPGHTLREMLFGADTAPAAIAAAAAAASVARAVASTARATAAAARSRATLAALPAHTTPPARAAEAAAAAAVAGAEGVGGHSRARSGDAGGAIVLLLPHPPTASAATVSPAAPLPLPLPPTAPVWLSRPPPFPSTTVAPSRALPLVPLLATRCLGSSFAPRRGIVVAGARAPTTATAAAAAATGMHPSALLRPSAPQPRGAPRDPSTGLPTHAHTARAQEHARQRKCPRSSSSSRAARAHL